MSVIHIYISNDFENQKKIDLLKNYNLITSI